MLHACDAHRNQQVFAVFASKVASQQTTGTMLACKPPGRLDLRFGTAPPLFDQPPQTCVCGLGEGSFEAGLCELSGVCTALGSGNALVHDMPGA